MTCGDTSAQWVPALGSAWTGEITDSSTAVEAIFVQLDSAVASVVDGVPLVGVWDFVDGQLTWTAATEGISYRFTVTATTCSGGKVTVADGGVGDSFGAGHPFTMSRAL